MMLVLTAACGGGESASPPSPPSTAAPAASGTNAAETVVPDVVMRDVASGADVNLRALAAPDRPTLYWFWAPH